MAASERRFGALAGWPADLSPAARRVLRWLRLAKDAIRAGERYVVGRTNEVVAVLRRWCGAHDDLPVGPAFR